jgi:hypothetical protein
MALDIKALIAKAGLTGEAAEAATKAFSSEALTTVIEEEAAHRANEAFQADRAKMQQNWDTANAEYIAMQAEKDAAEAKVIALETKFGATQAEKDAAAAKLAAAERKVADLSSFDPNKFKTEILTEAQKAAAEFNIGARSFELDALECVADHQQLFGERLSAKQLALDALAAKKDPQAYWEEKYNVKAKREEIAKNAHEKELSDHGKKVLDEYIAKQSNPSTRDLSDSRNPFYTPAADASKITQPWDMNDTPADEQAMFNELSRARVQ